jgi:penicillin-binding protein 2
MSTSFTKRIRKFFKSFFRRTGGEIFPDEIFLDSHNLPQFNTHQFEGRLEKPLRSRVFISIGFVFIVILGIFGFRLWKLQIGQGDVFAQKSENNRLDKTIIFPDRGVIYDRNHVALAWNEVNPENPDFSMRKYFSDTGLSSVLGFIKYPTKDKSGFYYQNFIGKDGVEKAFDDRLRGVPGTRLVEVDAHNVVQTENVLNLPVAGESLTLSIDSRIQHEFYDRIKALASDKGFTGGAAVMVDVRTGEVIAKVSYPEYSSEVMTDGSDTETISSYLNDQKNPFLDRVVDGLYTPGSIVKPYMALAALEENVISPEKKIESTGSISVPNPYQPGIFTVFKDWRAQGWINMRDALAVSSDVYFYEVGGGYKDQKGLGISLIDKYMTLFGFGKALSTPLFDGKSGTIPTPAWKAEHFGGEAWTLGNTYHTSIGQYGFQVSPVQVVRAMSSIATGGTIHEPTIIKGEASPEVRIPLDPAHYEIVREGMRQGVTSGISVALNVPYVALASKTGTAELGALKREVNSWDTGFFPYENPHYAFAVIMERGPSCEYHRRNFYRTPSSRLDVSQYS